MLRIHEKTTITGELAPVCLRLEAGGLWLSVGSGEAFPIPGDALETVMRRYGAPFDPDASVTRVASLGLGGGRHLHHLRHLAGYDVIARDYLLYERPEAEPLCAMSTTVAGALEYLARAGQRV
jgi:hypothetical protein